MLRDTSRTCAGRIACPRPKGQANQPNCVFHIWQPGAKAPLSHVKPCLTHKSYAFLLSGTWLDWMDQTWCGTVIIVICNPGSRWHTVIHLRWALVLARVLLFLYRMAMTKASTFSRHIKSQTSTPRPWIATHKKQCKDQHDPGLLQLRHEQVVSLGLLHGIVTAWKCYRTPTLHKPAQRQVPTVVPWLPHWHTMRLWHLGKADRHSSEEQEKNGKLL